MANKLSLRPRSGPLGPPQLHRLHRHGARVPVRLRASSAQWADGMLAGHAGTAPQLTLQESASARDQLASTGLSAALHALFLLALLLAALLTPPELIERVIPLELVRAPESIPLPGSNEPPAPSGPKRVGAARPNAASLAAAAAPAMTPAQAEALRQAALAAARRAVLERPSAPEQRALLPTQLERREVQAASVAARAAAAAAPDRAVDTKAIEAVAVDTTELRALNVDPTGPTRIDTSELADLSAPQAFEALKALGTPDYRGGIDAAALGTLPDLSGAGAPGGGGEGVDTSVSFAYAGEGGEDLGVGGGGTGGVGTREGVVSCLESAFVQRYEKLIGERTRRRWVVPPGVPPEAEVKLRFRIDPAGMVTDVRAVPGQDEALAESARQALLAASPFPPMDTNNRCLSEFPLRSTFYVPAR